MISLIHYYSSFNIPYLYPFEIVGVASNARANSGPLGNLPRKWVYIRRNEWTHWANLIDIFNLREKKTTVKKIGKSELLWIFCFIRDVRVGRAWVVLVAPSEHECLAVIGGTSSEGYTILFFLMSALVLPLPVSRSDELPGGQHVPCCCENIYRAIYINYQSKT